MSAGLQAERTALSWQRTGLSFGVLALLAARVLLEQVGVAGYLVALGGSLLVVVVFVVGQRRYRALRRTGHATGGLPLLVWSGVAVGLGLAGAVSVVVGFG